MLWGIDGRGEYGQEPEHVQSDSRRASTLAIGTEIERELGTEDDGRLLVSLRQTDLVQSFSPNFFATLSKVVTCLVRMGFIIPLIECRKQPWVVVCCSRCQQGLDGIGRNSDTAPCYVL